MSNLATNAQIFFEMGCKAVLATKQHFDAAKLAALSAGRHFRSAKALCEHGEFEQFCAAAKLSRMTAWRFIELVERCEAAIKEEHPACAGPRLDAAVDKMVLTTPKDVTAIMRELGIIKQVGAYDAAAYEQRKLSGTPQLVFAFEHFESQVRALVQTDTIRELSRRSLEKLNTELAEAKAKVEEALAGKTEEEPVHA